MDPRRQRAQQVIRGFGLLGAVDSFRFYAAQLRGGMRNRAFRRAFPDFAVPPKRLAFDANATVEWWWYKASGEAVAEEVAELVKKYCAGSPQAVLEWGCGPGRVIRHLPAMLKGSTIYGSDYNPESVAWCAKAIPNVRFVVNGLEPPLPFDIATFDCVCAISVVTHLSLRNAAAWVKELARVLRPGGLLLLWTNGDNIATALLPEERAQYDTGHEVVRRGVPEGKKFYLAFHPPKLVRHRLLTEFDILEHVTDTTPGGHQDIWVARTKLA